MKQEDKELLLKDLCARLPYDVKVCIELPNHQEKIFEKQTGDLKEITKYGGYLVNSKGIDYRSFNLDIKPYLRPMSSIVEKERKEVNNLIKDNRPIPYGKINNKGIDNLLSSVSVTSSVLIDWLNKYHFDYRGLIEKGLAIEVTTENNPYK